MGLCRFLMSSKQLRSAIHGSTFCKAISRRHDRYVHVASVAVARRCRCSTFLRRGLFMSLHLRLVYLALALFALAVTQWFFFPVYVIVFAQNGPLLLLLRV